MSSQYNQMRPFVHVVLFCVSAFAFANAQPKLIHADSSKFCSLYSFGDSFVDPGNNNFIATKARSNFRPYGSDFPGKVATGRFSNGLLFPDFLAYYLGTKKFQVPYLGGAIDYNNQVTAISFASAASGYDAATVNKTKTLQMSQQLRYFTEYKVKLQDIVGRTRAAYQIKKAVFYINAGTTDFAMKFFQDYLSYFQDDSNYFGELNRQQTLTDLPQYEDFLLKQLNSFIQGLWVQGARRFAVQGLPSLGCLPIVITKLPLDPNDPNVRNSPRKCLKYVNKISKEFNSLLQVRLRDLESILSETRTAYVDSEESLHEAIHNPKTNGFDEVNKGCCGTGHTEVGISCNERTPICVDASKYVFWDAGHPTEKTNEIIFNNNLPVIMNLIGQPPSP